MVCAILFKDFLFLPTRLSFPLLYYLILSEDSLIFYCVFILLKCRFFVLFLAGQGEWVGCALDIICKNGRIKLCFTEELIEKPDDGKSILGRLFKSKS